MSTTDRPLLKFTKVLCDLHSVCVCVEIQTYQISENVDYIYIYNIKYNEKIEKGYEIT